MGRVTHGDVLTGAAGEEDLVPFGGEQAYKAFALAVGLQMLVDALAGEGYAALAPALFDRQHKNFESGYTPDEIANARKFVANPDWGAMLRDTQAAISRSGSTGQ